MSTQTSPALKSEAAAQTSPAAAPKTAVERQDLGGGNPSSWLGTVRSSSLSFSVGRNLLDFRIDSPIVVSSRGYRLRGQIALRKTAPFKATLGQGCSDGTFLAVNAGTFRIPAVRLTWAGTKNAFPSGEKERVAMALSFQ